MEGVVTMHDLGQLSDFYADKRVLLTGHTGFKGSWLCLWLSELGAQVYGYSLQPPTQPSLFQEACIARRLTGHWMGDVRDGSAVLHALEASAPQIVLHLAAQPLVRASYADPRCTFETNVMGTINLLEGIRQTSSVRVCQIITSDKCYLNHERNHSYRENDALGGADPYSASKACAELVAASYRRSFFNNADSCVSLATSRAGNVIGGGDWAQDRLLPDCIRAFQRSHPVVLRYPDAIRPWQHVLEPLAGYLLLAKAQWENPAACSEAFNFGPEPSSHLSVAEVAEVAAKLWGGGRVQTPSGPPMQALQEANYLHLDITKASRQLGFRPVWNLATSLQHAIHWYRRHFDEGDGFDAAAACVQQIRDYTALAG